MKENVWLHPLSIGKKEKEEAYVLLDDGRERKKENNQWVIPT